MGSTTVWWRLPRVILAAALALLIAACGETGPAFPSRPREPAGWMTIEVGSGDIRMVLPPWLVPFESRAALFANEPPTSGAEAFLELHAEGPRTLESQPGFGESLERWLANRIGPAGAIRSMISRLPPYAANGNPPPTIFPSVVRSGAIPNRSCAPP